jgi:hypothetical protein
MGKMGVRMALSCPLGQIKTDNDSHEIPCLVDQGDNLAFMTS